MSAAEVFFDTNVLLYLLSADTTKARRLEALLMKQRGTISVQVLNEFANVARRKLGMSWPEIRDVLEQLGHSDWEGAEGWTLIALPAGGGPIAALGAVGPGGRPDTASINMIGVRPAARGQGLGTRLHAHLLALATQKFTSHSGGTEAENIAMRRIFAKHGSQLAATQMYFVQGNQR